MAPALNVPETPAVAPIDKFPDIIVFGNKTVLLQLYRVWFIPPIITELQEFDIVADWPPMIDDRLEQQDNVLDPPPTIDEYLEQDNVLQYPPSIEDWFE